ncbi:MAG: tetratricopeptide repeat protein [Gemmatimonadota bacterium]|nr:tetratricopeptide repeat protein [Gemmatimonadota bacterium]
MNPQNSQAALTALNGARPVLTHFETPRSAEDLAADIIDLWAGAEASLQALVGNSSLAGQQLIRAARQSELITLDQAHLLLEFLAARDRANRTSYKPTQADGDAAVEGFRALESSLTGKAPVRRATPSSPLQAVYTPRGQQQHPSPAPQPPPSPYAPPTSGGGYRQPPSYAGRKMSGPPTIEQPPPGSFTPPGGGSQAGGAGLGRSNIEHALAAAERRRWPKLSLPALIGAAVVLLIAAGIWFAFSRGGSGGDGLTAGVAAMNAGQREKARGEFMRAVKEEPNTAMPHVFLARLSRQEGDLASARAQLDTALRVEPKNQYALREMGLVLFSTKQYDLARRFFVRAVQADPQDRAAQGYLGCALTRLGRVQEGTKFINNAGTGSWQSCLQPLTTATPPPL